MKVAYVSVHTQGTGYAKAAIEYMMALDAVGVNVTARAVEMTQTRGDYPDRVKEFEQNDLNNVDAVIQHNLPSEFVYKSGVHNIGSFAYETTGFPNTNWKDHLDLMDSIVVFCKDQKRVLSTISQSLFDKTAVIPHPVNINKFKQQHHKIDFGIPKNTLKFYTIAEFSKRKNFAALLAAYLSEFSSSDNVALVIKTHVPTRDPATSSVLLKGMIQEVKNNIGRFNPNSDRYPNIILLTDYMTNEQINALHNTCDVFVSSSHAESFCALPGTFVDTVNGQKKVEDIIIGDKVITHLANEENVINVLSRQYNGTIVEITPRGLSYPLSFTEDHTHYIVKRGHKKLFKDIVLQASFVSAKDIKKGDFWVVPKLKQFNTYVNQIKISDFINVEVNSNGTIECPYSNKSKFGNYKLKDIANIFNCSFQTISEVINNTGNNSQLCQDIKKYVIENNIQKKPNVILNNSLDLTQEFMFFIGHYIAEGWCSGSSINLSTHIDEQYGRDLSSFGINTTFGLKTQQYQVKKQCTVLNFNNLFIAKLMPILCGNRAKNKYIHSVLKKNENIRYLLQGLFYGDGHFSNNRCSFSTSSDKLASDIVEILNRNNIFAVKGSYIRDGSIEYNVTIIAEHMDRFINLVNPIKYSEFIKLPKYDLQSYLIEDTNNFYLPIKKVEKKHYSGIVYNLSVDKDNSYTTNGYATHNCLPFVDAIGFGKPTIVPKHTAFLDYQYDHKLFVNSSLTPVVNTGGGSVPGLYTSDEKWYNISLSDLREKMRLVYENQRLFIDDGISEARKLVVEKTLSREVIGNQYKNLILSKLKG